MDPFESNSSENMDKMLKDYANYKNICDAFKRDRETEQLKYCSNLPPISMVRRTRNARLSRPTNYSYGLLENNSSATENYTDVEVLEKKEDISEDTDSAQESDYEQSIVGKKYKEKFRKRTAEMQQELELIKHERQNDLDAHESAMQSIEEKLKKEQSDNNDRCKGVASHYDSMLLRTKQLSCRLQEDHCNVELKMNSLREQVGSLHSELHEWLDNKFDDIMSKFDAFGTSPEAFKLNFVDDNVTTEAKAVRLEEQKDAGRTSIKKMGSILCKGPEKSPTAKVVRFKKEPCPRLDRGRFSKNV